MNPTGTSHFNQSRIEWAIRLRYSPLPELDMKIINSQLNAFRIGELRVIGKTWEVMMERDAELAVNSDKRKSDASGLDWQIVSDGSPLGDRHAAALQYFYDNLTATHALDQDATGGTDELIYQTLSAVDNYYSAHEILLRIDNPAAREVTAEFRHTPLWFFEARRGYLGYLQHIFDVYGQPCVKGEWLTAVNQGWMRSLALVFGLKSFAVRDWSLFNARYGSGFLDAQTSAQEGTAEWNGAMKALENLANDGAVLHNDTVNFKFLEQSGRNALPFEPMVQWCNALYAKCYRGVDLATSSRSGQMGSGVPGLGSGGKEPVGASVQKEESGIFLVRDAKWVTGVFNERIDRPMIQYLFGQEPRAWFALMPPPGDYRREDLTALQTLVPMGLRVALKDVYQRFRWQAPADKDPCLTPPAAGAETANFKLQPSENIQDSSAKPDEVTSDRTSTDDALHRGGDSLSPQKTGSGDKLSPPQPIAAGATPGAQQTASAEMPDPQSDAAAFEENEEGRMKNEELGKANLFPRGADGQTLPMPSLGYSLPNEKLEKLQRAGLGNSRAAQGLRGNLTPRRGGAGTHRTGGTPGQAKQAALLKLNDTNCD